VSFEPGLDRLGGGTEESRRLLDLARVADIGKHGITLPRGIRAGLETSRHYAPERAAYAALVEVAPETGGVTILRHVIGHDGGGVIDPLPVDVRIPGGRAHGIGNAMHEEPVRDAEGRPQTVSRPGRALVPAARTPDAELFHIQTPSPLNHSAPTAPGRTARPRLRPRSRTRVEDARRPHRARVNRAAVTPARLAEAIGADLPEGP
jgi:carbon-monoxide dehydrogenase large subunit